MRKTTAAKTKIKNVARSTICLTRKPASERRRLLPFDENFRICRSTRRSSCTKTPTTNFTQASRSFRASSTFSSLCCRSSVSCCSFSRSSSFVGGQEAAFGFGSRSKPASRSPANLLPPSLRRSPRRRRERRRRSWRRRLSTRRMARSQFYSPLLAIPRHDFKL